MAANKSSITETISQLERFIYWLADKNQDPDNIMMEYDELVGEFLAELVKGDNQYGHLPLKERCAVIRRMIDNRLGELKYRFYLTHRKAVKMHLSIDIELSEEDDISTVEDVILTDDDNPEILFESAERVMATRNRLSIQARQVFDALVYGNDRLALMVLISAMRAEAIYKSPTAKLAYLNVADALFMGVEEVKAAFGEIRNVYSEVLNG